ncbi:hypothetical protein MAPG_06016 [Magnaporthiopsis poae ATCC 64411]|uniref:F-box domain-containing protein n=1 Tax=Magnaporthiopsis poae (strain ATCC 64411 / 73-15) TaxID=644358 RepID=A0A0C4E0X6_MAGP6|nr:hypothetical protein MAPG_06016 [Magnaporthiopsis poae ATCC 64411]
MARRREIDLRIPRAPLVPAKFSWTLFARFPRELQLEILERCNDNDLVCLSVTCHFFRAATLPLIPAKPSLLAFHWNMPRRLDAGNHRSVYKRQFMRIRRQEPCDHDVQQPNRRRECPRPGCIHCQCTTCPLYMLLGSSMGAGRKFCFTCRKFTKRSKAESYRGRCLHGRILGKRRRTNHGWSKKMKPRTASEAKADGWVSRFITRMFPPRAPPPPREGPRRSPRTPVPRKRRDDV